MSVPRHHARATAWLAEVTAKARRAILIRHARLLPDGSPAFCAERGKAIFDTRAAAEAAARELEQIGGALPLRAYPCPRSKHGHHHLTSSPKH